MAQFEPGQSGNPAGRPPGIRDRRQAMRDKLASHADELIAKVVELAKEGDSAALRICIERLIPPAKAKDDPLELPDMTGGTLADSAKAVLSALAEGRITPDEAATMMSALTSQARVIETSEIERRLAALEEAAKTREGHEHDLRPTIARIGGKRATAAADYSNCASRRQSRPGSGGDPGARR